MQIMNVVRHNAMIKTLSIPQINYIMMAKYIELHDLRLYEPSIEEDIVRLFIPVHIAYIIFANSNSFSYRFHHTLLR